MPSQLKVQNDYVTPLIEYLFKYKVASIKQIGRDLFPDLKSNSVLRRLQRLRSRKLIIPAISSLHPNEKIYSLSAKGFRDIMGSDSVERKELLSQAVSHDLALVDIGEKLKSCPAVEHFYPENVLKTKHGLVGSEIHTALQSLSPDGIIKADFGTKKLLLAMEYEATIKAEKRYKNLFQSYYLAPKIAGVLYICKNSRMISKLMEIERNILPCHHSKFFYTTLDDLLSAPKPHFTTLDGSVLFLEKQAVR